MLLKIITRENMKRFTFFIFIILPIICSANELPLDGILVANTTYSGACNTQFLGTHDGNVSFEALFDKQLVTCDAGTYLPANSEECIICPINNFCIGGDYELSTENQGIENCPNKLKSPLGSTLSAQCGQIFHVGDSQLYLSSEKQTNPALVVEISGKNYYAQMTKTSDGKKTISADSNVVWHTIINDIEYTIHDKTSK